MTSTANALLVTADFRGIVPSFISDGEAGSAAVVTAALSTAGAALRETGATDEFVAPCFGGAFLESELTNPGGS